MGRRLESLADRVRDDRAFLGAALHDYARSEGLSREELAEVLGVDAAELPALELCRRPREERFRDDIGQIAERFGADADVLAEAVRRSDALAMLREAEAADGTLMAARDREDPPS